MAAAIKTPLQEDLRDLTLKLKKALELKSSDPNGPIYQSLRRLVGKCYLKQQLYPEAAFSFAEALGPTARTMAAYRTERKSYDGDATSKIQTLSKQIDQIVSVHRSPQQSEDPLLNYLQKWNTQYKSNSNKYQWSSNVNEKVSEGHLKKEHVMHKVRDEELQISEMMSMLDQLPAEWTLVQIAAGYEPCEMWQTQKCIRSAVKEFHLSVLKSNTLTKNHAPPFTVTIAPDNVPYGETPLFEELHLTLEENLRVIETRVGNCEESIKKYWEKRTECDRSMKGVVNTMDVKWLGGWRYLLAGNIMRPHLTEALQNCLQEAYSQLRTNLNAIQKMLVFNLATSAHLLTYSEIGTMLGKIYVEYSDTETVAGVRCETCGEVRRLSQLCVGCEKTRIVATGEFKAFRKVLGDLISKIKSQEVLKDLKHSKRGPVILLLDEKLDIFPWEILPALNGQPVTRMESLHFAYALYKAQETQIKGGYYLLRPNKGRYLINPGGDLDRMEKRMGAFIEYWCPNWEGDKNKQPSPEVFQKYLQDSDIFLYCGHNDGSQYMSGGVERLESAKAVSTLSGCGSVRVRPPGTRLLALPVHTHYHIATCPSIIGMLWEVTDLEVDKVTSMLLGVFLPPTNKQTPHWGQVSKVKWTQGKIDPVCTETTSKFQWEPNLLRALAVSRRSTSFMMIAASVIARGIPVRIDPDYQ